MMRRFSMTRGGTAGLAALMPTSEAMPPTRAVSQLRRVMGSSRCGYLKLNPQLALQRGQFLEGDAQLVQRIAVLLHVKNFAAAEPTGAVLQSHVRPVDRDFDDA